MVKPPQKRGPKAWIVAAIAAAVVVVVGATIAALAMLRPADVAAPAPVDVGNATPSEKWTILGGDHPDSSRPVAIGASLDQSVVVIQSEQENFDGAQTARPGTVAGVNAHSGEVVWTQKVSDVGRCGIVGLDGQRAVGDLIGCPGEGRISYFDALSGALRASVDGGAESVRLHRTESLLVEVSHGWVKKGERVNVSVVARDARTFQERWRARATGMSLDEWYGIDQSIVGSELILGSTDDRGALLAFSLADGRQVHRWAAVDRFFRLSNGAGLAFDRASGESTIYSPEGRVLHRNRALLDGNPNWGANSPWDWDELPYLFVCDQLACNTSSAMDLDGRRYWTLAANAWFVKGYCDRTYLVRYADRFIGVDATSGSIRWEKPVRPLEDGSTFPIACRPDQFFGAAERKVVLYDTATGEKLWSASGGNMFLSLDAGVVITDRVGERIKVTYYGF